MKHGRTMNAVLMSIVTPLWLRVIFSEAQSGKVQGKNENFLSGQQYIVKGWLFVKKNTPLHVAWVELGFGLKS